MTNLGRFGNVNVLAPGAGLETHVPPGHKPGFAESGNPPPAGAGDWYYMAGGRQVGPITLDEAKSLIAANAINASTFVWKTGLPDWLPLSQTELAAFANAVQPPPFNLGGPGQTGPGAGGSASQAPPPYQPSGLYSPPDSPPYSPTPFPGSPVQVDNTFLWYLVFAPVAVLLLQIIIDIATPESAAALVFVFISYSLYYLAILAVVSLLFKDIFLLSGIGIRFDNKKVIFFGFIPYYLYIRSKILNHSSDYFIAGTICYLLSGILNYLYFVVFNSV